MGMFDYVKVYLGKCLQHIPLVLLLRSPNSMICEVDMYTLKSVRI